jgi:hypothetical protein
MSISAYAGPIVAYPDPINNANPELAPSAFIEGHGLLDPRPFFTYNPGQDFGALTAFFNTTTMIQTLNIAPATKSAVAIAPANNTVNGTPMVLISSTTGGVTVGKSVVNPNTGNTVTGLLAIGDVSKRVSFGTAKTMQAWDPSSLTARTLIITCNSASGAGGNFTIAGYDIYGFPMTETLTSNPSGSLTVTGLKAWKYIASVTPAFTDATYTYSVGTTDVFGLPLSTLVFGDTLYMYPVSGTVNVVTNPAGYLPAVNTAATALTGDVRGTYALQTASNGSNVLIAYQNPTLAALALPNGVAGTSSGLFGVKQF